MDRKNKIIADYWHKLENQTIQCDLCPHFCKIELDHSGICRKRVNIDSVLIAENYGKTTGIQIDPIEKKPLYHFYPGTQILSLGANSCNFKCKFCQNYTISQQECKTELISPVKILDICKEYNISSVAFTYSEPITWYEFIIDCAKLLKENNKKIVMVSNGFINEEPLKKLLLYTDAWNVDLKAFNEEFYKNVCFGSLQPVLNAIKIINEKNHIEVTHLMIEDVNDDVNDFIELVKYISRINENIPLHVSRYFPKYLMNNPATTILKINESIQNAKSYLKYVYSGNIILENMKENNTYCSFCHTELIERHTYSAYITNMKKNKCKNCGKELYGVFS